MGKTHSNIYSLPPANFSPSDKIGRVWLGIRRLVRFLKSPNHWSIILEAGQGFLTVQLDVDGSIGISYQSDLRSAALATWGNQKSDVRLSECGKGNGRTLGEFLDKISGNFTYILGFYDCQNFCREMVDFLTGKTIGIWPKEDGPRMNLIK